MTKLGLLALGLSLLPTVAVANTIASDGSDTTYAKAPWGGEQRLEGRVSWLIGGADVGDANGWSTGIAGSLGYRVGDVTLRAMIDYYRIGDGGDEAQSRHGRSTRVGGALRYSIIHSKPSDEAGVDFWTELGAGYEHAAWTEGGVLDRPSGEFAIGFDFDARGKESSPGRRRHIGYFMAFRALFGEGPEMPGPPICGGPCDRATKPSRLDSTMFFELGVHWGR